MHDIGGHQIDGRNQGSENTLPEYDDTNNFSVLEGDVTGVVILRPRSQCGGGTETLVHH